jgi:hypothetical protein
MTALRHLTAKGDGTNDDTTAIQLVNGPTLRNMQVVWTEK